MIPVGYGDVEEQEPMIPWEVEAGYSSPSVRQCQSPGCLHFWFRGMLCPYCGREVE